MTRSLPPRILIGLLFVDLAACALLVIGLSQGVMVATVVAVLLLAASGATAALVVTRANRR